MSQSIFCKNCKTKTEVTVPVMRRINKGWGKVEIEDLNINCCESPDLYWVASKEIYTKAADEVNQEDIAGEIKKTREKTRVHHG